jgi:hypothetical protein
VWLEFWEKTFGFAALLGFWLLVLLGGRFLVLVLNGFGFWFWKFWFWFWGESDCRLLATGKPETETKTETGQTGKRANGKRNAQRATRRAAGRQDLVV